MTPATYRRVRLAASVCCVLVAFALSALWTRSYWQFDQWVHRRSPTEFAAVTTTRGRLTIGRSNDPMLEKVFRETWTRRGFALKNIEAEIDGPVAYFPASTGSLDDTELAPLPRFRRQPFIVAPGTTYTELILPYWLLVLPFVSLAYLLVRAPTKFSLRSLLIATTIVAVVLGLGTWVAS